MSDIQLAVIGGGPAGCSAAVMACSLGLRPVVFERALLGGRVPTISQVSNLLGFSGEGNSLATTWAAHLGRMGVEVKLIGVARAQWLTDRGVWELLLDDGRSLSANWVVAATGTRNLPASTHPLIDHAQFLTKEVFLDLSSYSDLLGGHEVLIIGSDRPLATFVRSLKVGQAPQVIHVLALPDKAYALEELEDPDFVDIRIHRVSRVLEIGPDGDGITALAATEDGSQLRLSAERSATNLGVLPATEPFLSWPLTSDGYLFSGRLPRLALCAGDVSHEGFQRISVALGKGAQAALQAFYITRHLYGY